MERELDVSELPFGAELEADARRTAVLLSEDKVVTVTLTPGNMTRYDMVLMTRDGMASNPQFQWHSQELLVVLLNRGTSALIPVYGGTGSLHWTYIADKLTDGNEGDAQVISTFLRIISEVS